MKLNNNFTLEEIVRGCKSNDRKMQELLYRVYASKLMAVCMRYAQSRMEAEDVLQMSFIKIFNKINDFKGTGAFEGWMRRIVVNTAIEEYRKNQKHLNVMPIEEMTEQSLTHVDVNQYDAKVLISIIQKLASGYRMVFNMYVIEGYSHQEIANHLGISEGASKSQLSRARAILQKEILKMEECKYETH